MNRFEKAEAELAPLRERAARLSDPQAEAQRLARENLGKSDWLIRRQNAIEQMREEISQLKKSAKK